VTDLVFFSGTLMAAFRRPRGLSVDSRLTSCGRGSISVMLFDLGTYPAAVPATGSRCRIAGLQKVKKVRK
jgi:hypothetical protein